jgi:hypothetical protein
MRKMKGAFLRRTTAPAAFLMIASLALSGCYTQLSTGTRLRAAPAEERRPEIDVESLALRTDGAWFDMDPDKGYVTIWAQFENSGEQDVSLAGCPEPPAFVIERWENDDWSDVASVGYSCPALYSNHIAQVRPDEPFEFEFSMKQPGWYRLRLAVGPYRDFPDALLYSNPFLVR